MIGFGDLCLGNPRHKHCQVARDDTSGRAINHKRSTLVWSLHGKTWRFRDRRTRDWVGASILQGAEWFVKVTRKLV